MPLALCFKYEMDQCESVLLPLMASAHFRAPSRLIFLFFLLPLCKTNPRLPSCSITPFLACGFHLTLNTQDSNISRHCRLSVLRWQEWRETCVHQRRSESLKSKLHHGCVLNTCGKDSLAILFCIVSQRECPYCFPRERQWSHSKSTNPVTICRCRPASEMLCASPQTVLSVILGPAHSL